jgi:hypothetical protein
MKRAAYRHQTSTRKFQHQRKTTIFKIKPVAVPQLTKKQHLKIESNEIIV